MIPIYDFSLSHSTHSLDMTREMNKKGISQLSLPLLFHSWKWWRKNNRRKFLLFAPPSCSKIFVLFIIFWLYHVWRRLIYKKEKEKKLMSVDGCVVCMQPSPKSRLLSSCHHRCRHRKKEITRNVFAPSQKKHSKLHFSIASRLSCAALFAFNNPNVLE